MDKKIYLFANWKMYLGVKLAKNYTKLKYPKNADVAIFPSAIVFSDVVKEILKTDFSVGAQNIYWADKGGYTGEVAAATYYELGAKYSLVGHSERRHLFHESNHDVRLKIETLLQLGMTPVLCVGETAEEREKNLTEEVLESQIRSVYMDLIWPTGLDLIIAYEPVWAIGTGESCDPKEAEKNSTLISGWVEKLTGNKSVVLYGGSVRGENIGHYLEENHISGVLVGGASAKIETWSELVAQLK
jgi:triosephosphate isomerase